MLPNIMNIDKDLSATYTVRKECCGVSAEFFDNDRFILVLHRNGDVEIFGGEDRTVSYGKIHLENCDLVGSLLMA